MKLFRKIFDAVAARFIRKEEDKRVIYHGRNTIEKFHRYKVQRTIVHRGCPKLTGARLVRTIAQCDPRHLLVQPRFRLNAPGQS